MCRIQFSVGLVVLYVGFTQSWDIAVTHGDVLEFYTNDRKTDSVRFDSHHPAALAYDEIHNMLLYVDKQSDNDSICGHDISSKLNQCFTKRHGRNIHGLAFDPATEVLFFTDTNERTINWISLKSGSNIYENLLIKMDHGTPTDIAVDSCRGLVYWINTNLITPTIEKARYDGSEREVVIKSELLSMNSTYKLEPHSLTIDQQTQRIYWIEPETRFYSYIYYADLNKERKLKNILCRINFDDEQFTNPSSNTLTVSKTYLYRARWCSDCDIKVSMLNKIAFRGVEVIDLHTQNVTVGLAANYRIKEQIQDINNCEALSGLVRKSSSEPFCVHGAKFIEESLCKCKPGYIGERCDVSVCENYCIQGICDVNDEGIPQCRCNEGYAGERCEVDACLNYCIQGNCSFNDEGLPTCSCIVGYSGQRCEAVVCQNYCLNNGVCFLNEEDEPSCECADRYEGSRCEAVQTVTFTFSNMATYSAEDTSPTLANVLSNVRNNSTNIFIIVDKS